MVNHITSPSPSLHLSPERVTNLGDLVHGEVAPTLPHQPRLLVLHEEVEVIPDLLLPLWAHCDATDTVTVAVVLVVIRTPHRLCG